MASCGDRRRVESAERLADQRRFGLARLDRGRPHAEPGEAGAGDLAAVEVQRADQADQREVARPLRHFAEQGDACPPASAGKWIAVSSSSGSSVVM